jgi:hypothetical protein
MRPTAHRLQAGIQRVRVNHAALTGNAQIQDLSPWPFIMACGYRALMVSTYAVDPNAVLGHRHKPPGYSIGRAEARYSLELHRRR